ncbi:MAG: sulfotransferase [Alphaproteobacteria bacterium]|tara:strand:- start:316 stop:2316 length:2001 start_codon:yes stop_codon:yes gene_type:complete
MAKQSPHTSLVMKLIKENKFKEAHEYVLLNLEQDSNHIESLYFGSVCARYLKNYQQSNDYLERLLTLSPDMGRAYQELGHLNRDRGSLELAAGYYRQACEMNPALISSWQFLYDYYRDIGKKDASSHALEQLENLKSLPNTLLYINQILYEGKLSEAEKMCRDFLKKDPKNTEAMSILSEIASRLGYLEDAEFLLENAVNFEPNNPELRKKYLIILRKKQKFSKAMIQAEYLCKTFPKNLSYKAQMAIEIMQNGDYEKAIEIFDSILKKAPNDPNTLTSKGHALKTFGNNIDAIKSYKLAHKAKPDHGEAYFSLANLKTYSFKTSEIALMKNQLENVNLLSKDRVYFHFALAYALEKEGEYEEAFFHLEKGNEIKKINNRYSIKGMKDEIHSQIQICDSNFFSSHGEGGLNKNDPIFILGLPRSGSTLIEQILASHSQIDGTLELPNILSMAHGLRGHDRLSNEGKYPSVLKSLTKDQRKEMGLEYITDTFIHRDKAPRFTDKMPNNFRHIGLIHLILPNAKIIDARRYPLDCCFSIYKQLFAQGQEFSYGLEEIGNYYRNYIDLMDHWNRVLPGKILKVNNEDIINDLEGQVKRIIDYLELPFEKECISFYNTKRSVRTASSEQVRKPINKDGVERWKPYSKKLKPLVDCLGEELLKPEDIALIN